VVDIMSGDGMEDRGKTCNHCGERRIVSVAAPRFRRYSAHIFTRVAIEAILSASSLGARLRWAARADEGPTATKGGDPSGTYKRWFGRVSGRDGWWRGSHSILVLAGMPLRDARRLVATRATGPMDGRSDAVALRTTFVRR
jgi:hypothetical protein